jgi:hypothetical protein
LRIAKFSNVFNSKITIGTKDDSDILIESIFGDSILNNKKWTHSFFFSGEPKKNEPEIKKRVNEVQVI